MPFSASEWTSRSPAELGPPASRGWYEGLPRASHVEIGSLGGRFGIRLHTEWRPDSGDEAVSHLILWGDVDHRVTASAVGLLDSLIADAGSLSLEFTGTDVATISPLNAHWLLGAAMAARHQGGELLLTGAVHAESLRRAAVSLNVPSSTARRCRCRPGTDDGTG